MRALGYRGEQVLAVVSHAFETSGRAPSYAYIGQVLGMDVPNVCHVVRRLERRGFLRRQDTGSRHRKGWHGPVIVLE